MIPYRSIESVEHIDSPISADMVNALDDWQHLYTGKAPWIDGKTIKSLNLPALICSEIARQILIEAKWNITGKKKGDDDEPESNPRAEYLKAEFEKLMRVLRQKLEQGCAAGGMVIKPYPKDGHIYFDFTLDWSLYPVSFTDDGNLSDVIFRNTFSEGDVTYTRLERHERIKDGGADGKEAQDAIRITQRAFKSTVKEAIGTEIPLTEVPQWADLKPESIVKQTDGQMFGWYKVASANAIDIDCPIGASVFSKAREQIKEADTQYSRLLWEYEGSELAIDVDPTALRPRKDGKGYESPKLNERLFRGVDMGTDDTYKIFSPTIRDVSLINGLNQILMRIEDLCGISRGTISDVNTEARTATELKIVRQRTYATIHDNQTSLENCLRDVIRAMDKYATLYNLAPKGEYEVSFEWDDSVLTDMDQQVQEWLMLLNAGIIGKAEFREWYFGETQTQAAARIEAITEEKTADVEALLPPTVPEPTNED